MKGEPFKYPAPGVLAKDLRPCDSCGKPLAKCEGEPVSLSAYRIRFDSLFLDQHALQQMGGLSIFFGGNEVLAGIFTPGPELYKCFGRDELLVCLHCYARCTLAAIVEGANDRRCAEAEKTAATGAVRQGDGDPGDVEPEPGVSA